VADDETLAELSALAEDRHRDPAAVRDRAAALLAAPASAAVAPVAEWVLGLALHELGEPAEAAGHLRRAARHAGRGGDAETEALARAGLAISLLSLGRTPAARREITRADAGAPPAARGRIDFLHALVLQRVGELDNALARYRDALPRLRRDGDEHSVARALLNQGTLRAYQGATDAALADFAAVEDLAGRLGLPVLVAMAAHNAGFALGRRGAVGDALRAFDRAAASYAQLGSPPRLVAVLASDRCEVLLQVGLADDARRAAEGAVAALDGIDAAHAAEARLLLAQACLAAGDLERAATEAAAAGAAFRAARRGPWAALAGYVGMQAVIRAEQDAVTADPGLLTRALAAARRLEEQGWRVEALHARTFVGRVALAVGQPELAEAELARAADARGRGPVGERAQAWHATALVRLARDDPAGAKDALRRGLAVIDAYRARLGATELRIGAAAHGEDLSRLGLRLALAGGRAWEVLRWAERWRAGALRLPPVSPPDDSDLAAALADLRSAEADVREATLAGAGQAAALARIVRLERTVRDAARRAVGAAAPAGARALSTADLGAALGERALVEFVNVEGVLHAVTVCGRRAVVRAVAATSRVEDEVRFLVFALRRVLAPATGRAVLRGLGDAAVAGTAAPSTAGPLARPGGGMADVEAAARRLDDLLVAPLGLDPEVPVVVVPTRPLHQVAWAALPSLAGRAVTVAPSAELWLRPPGRGAGSAPPVVVAGPGLPGADAEAAAVAAGYPGSRLLRGEDATVDGVLAALAAAGLAHVAAHGRLRSDSPLFSSLTLADGALTLYDLERLASPPTTFVLPACDAAVPAVARGDEVLGTATALVGLGVRSVVAPVLPVPDAATAPFMLAVHARLRAGDPPSRALARAGARAADPAVAAAFVCLGADEGPVVSG
jgi:tetratricopeptide (TPR) repeat protein